MTYRILLCDDEPHILRASEIKFTRAGFDVTCVSDGQHALETIQSSERPFDVVVTDYQMPRMNGLQLITHLREDASTSDTPVILLTAKGFELDEADLRERLKVSHLMAKPFSPRELLMRVTQMLEGSSLPVGIDLAVTHEPAN